LRVFFDTNVVLDLLLAREPWVDDASELIDLVERGELIGVLGATTLTTVYYVAASARDAETARQHVEDLLRLFEVAPVTRSVLKAALGTGMSDFEDAVLHEAGREAAVDALVTRDLRGFAAGEIPVYQPRELLVALDSVE
jgi:predicted nucleic acid-binding protein